MNKPDKEERAILLQSLDIEYDLKVDLFSNNELFETFYRGFLAIHIPGQKKEEEPSKSKESLTRDNFFINALNVLMLATKFLNPDMLTLAEKYTWRFINTCVNEVTKDTKNNTPAKGKETGKYNERGEVVVKKEITRTGATREIVRLN